MLGIGAVPLPAVAPVVGGDALAAVEYLDSAGGEPYVDLLADQGVGHRVEEARSLDVIVEVDPRQPQLGEDVKSLPSATPVSRPMPTPWKGEVGHKLVFGDGMTSVDITADPTIAAVPG